MSVLDQLLHPGDGVLRDVHTLLLPSRATAGELEVPRGLLPRPVLERVVVLAARERAFHELGDG